MILYMSKISKDQYKTWKNLSKLLLNIFVRSALVVKY